MRTDANVWRASWRPIGSSSALLPGRPGSAPEVRWLERVLPRSFRRRDRLGGPGGSCGQRGCLGARRRREQLVGRRGSWARSRRSPCRHRTVRRGSRRRRGRRLPSGGPSARRDGGRRRAPSPRSGGGSAAKSRCASSGDAIRSRRPLTAGSRRCVHGLTATSPSSSARRKMTRSGISAFRIVEGRAPRRGDRRRASGRQARPR